MNTHIKNAASFGAALRSRRKELGLTQAQISRLSGFSVSFISDLENGKPTAELEKVLCLASILTLDVTVTPGDKST